MKRRLGGLILMGFTMVMGVGIAYSQGTGASPSAQEALAKGNAAWDSKNYEESARWWRIAATQGNAEAQWRLADQLLAEVVAEQFAFARGEKPNQQVIDSKTKEALDWLRRSAEQGYANAENELGQHYYNEGDKEKGLILLRKAAAQGNEDAKTHLRRACTDVCDSTYKTCMNPCNLDSACIDACQRDWKACKEACGGN